MRALSMRLAAAAFVLALVGCTGGPPDSVPEAGEHWISTWGTAQQLAVTPPLFGPGARPPQPRPAANPPRPPANAPRANAAPPPPRPPAAPTVVSNQTVRMVARATVGGTAIRVALSNSYGLAPLSIEAARLAKEGEQISHALTFGGREAVVIPPGAQLYSDPIDYDLAGGTDLVVSLYVPATGVTPTTHPVGLRTGWLAPGNQVVEEQLVDATEMHSYLWLAGIEVQAPDEAATIVALGDSITDGFSTTPDADTPWPSLLAQRLAVEPDMPGRAVINMGISGNRVLRETTGNSALARFDRDVVARPGTRWVILLEAINDIGLGYLPGFPADQRPTAEDLIAAYRMLINRAHLHGMKMIGGTLTPFEGTPTYTAESEQMRQDVNRWIREGGEFDGIVDFDAATRDPDAPTKLLAAYDSGDHIHPNDAGNRAMADAVDLSLFR